ARRGPGHYDDRRRGRRLRRLPDVPPTARRRASAGRLRVRPRRPWGPGCTRRRRGGTAAADAGRAGGGPGPREPPAAGRARRRGRGRGGGFGSDNPAFAKFQACLKQHGVTTGGGVGGAGRGFSPANRAAFTACRSLLPAGGGFFGRGGNGNGGAGNGSISPFGRFQACLRQHGVQPGAAGQAQAKTAAAIAACRSVLPNGGGAGSTTTTTTG